MRAVLPLQGQQQNSRHQPSVSCTSDPQRQKGEKTGEDFSFHRLMNRVQTFEKKQKEHYMSKALAEEVILKPESSVARNNNHYHYQHHHHVNDKAIASTSSFGTVTTVGSTISSVSGSDSYEDKERELQYDCTDEGVNNTSIKPASSSTSTEVIYDSNEDFSFQKLKTKALGTQKSTTKLCIQGGEDKQSNENEDFSFQKLKDKALDVERNGPATPIQRIKKNRCHHTPIKTPTRNTPSRIISAPHTVCGKSQHRPLAPLPQLPSLYNTRSRSAPRKRLDDNEQYNHKNNSTSKSHIEKATAPLKGTTTFNKNKFQFKPKIKKEEVQATNDSIASVQKLSKWLSDDPFDKKKQLHIRKGEKIATKSKLFEIEELVSGHLSKKESRVKREMLYFPEGKVSKNKDWLQQAFGEGKKEQDACVEDQSLSIIEKKKLIESAFKKKAGKINLRMM